MPALFPLILQGVGLCIFCRLEFSFGLLDELNKRVDLNAQFTVEELKILDQTVKRRPKLTLDWSGPLGPDRRQAADLTVGRGLRSSNCCGLR